MPLHLAIAAIRRSEGINHFYGALLLYRLIAEERFDETCASSNHFTRYITSGFVKVIYLVYRFPCKPYQFFQLLSDCTHRVHPRGLLVSLLE